MRDTAQLYSWIVKLVELMKNKILHEMSEPSKKGFRGDEEKKGV